MVTPLNPPSRYPLRYMRVDTLVRLRWLAAVGQAIAVLVVSDGLDFDLPLWACLSVIALYAWVNVALRVRFRGNQRLESDRAAWLIGFDIAEISVLLFLTGGLQNPFTHVLLGPVLIAATFLPARLTFILAGFAIVCATTLMFLHYPLPWTSDAPLTLPTVYLVGDWFAILLAIGYISGYAWWIARDARQLADALAVTEMVLSREQHLTQLDGLAAAAAHELGTPLSTIAVIAKELEREFGSSSPHADDIRLLREQAQRCGDILGKLTQLPAAGEPFETMKLSALVEEVVAPHRNFGVAIDVAMNAERSDEPIGARNPAILYGLGNILENAVDFAHARVDVTAAWDSETVSVTIGDDGPGFSPEIKDQMGEPYVTSRRQRRRDSGAPGLGLGFFIAKTLLERSGATLSLGNRAFPQRGAIVCIRWNRVDFERPADNALT